MSCLLFKSNNTLSIIAFRCSCFDHPSPHQWIGLKTLELEKNKEKKKKRNCRIVSILKTIMTPSGD